MIYNDLMSLYPTGHTVSEDTAILLIENMHSNKSPHATKIQAYRKFLGMSQRELSEAADVNLRTLQQYEVRDKEINKAAAVKVITLSKVLMCKPEDLME